MRKLIATTGLLVTLASVSPAAAQDLATVEPASAPATPSTHPRNPALRDLGIGIIVVGGLFSVTGGVSHYTGERAHCIAESPCPDNLHEPTASGMFITGIVLAVVGTLFTVSGASQVKNRSQHSILERGPARLF